MFKRLKRKLTWLYAMTTGSILTLVVIGLLFYNTRIANRDAYQNFQNEIVSISSHMQFGSTISGSWLARTEASEKLVIHVEENSVPFLYAGSWTPATDRSLLLERAKEAALKEKVNPSIKPVSSSVIQSSIFTITGDDGDSYYGTVLILPTTKGFQSLTLLGYRTPDSALIKKQGPLFLLADLAGIAALYLVSRYFVGKSLKPVETSQKRQNEFIAAASHELRSPLAVIESSISAIDSEPQKQAQYLKNIRSECRRMAVLVGDMLLLAYTDAGIWTLRRTDVDVDTLLIDIYELFEPVCREKRLRLFLNLPEAALPHVNGDASRLRQLFTILLDNAISYTPEGKQISIGAVWKGKELVLSVTDQGRGIPDNMKKRIFDRFYRGDLARTDKKHFGLGLSIAKELTALHGGIIRVTDTEGGGTTFLVTLPATAAKL